MPGTGHSARYKGSISNRSKISPFEHLAKWNQQLLGADGAVPSIVGGNSLEFKKLDATNIAGVMHNPAIADLNMNCLNIIQIGELRLCNGGRINSQPISGTDTMRIDSENKELLITNSSYNTTGANMIKIRPGDAATGSNGGTIQLEFLANTKNHTVNIGNNMGNAGGQGIINIGVVNSTTGSTFVNIGSAGLDKVDITSGGSELKLQAGTATLSGNTINIGTPLSGNSINIGNSTCDGVNIFGNSTLSKGVTIGVGVQQIKMGENATGLPQGIHIGTSSTSSKIRFFDVLEPWGRRSIVYPGGTSITDLSNAVVNMSSNAFGTDLKRQIIKNYNTLYCLLRALDNHAAVGPVVTEGGLGLIKAAGVGDTCVDLVGDGVNPIPVPP